MAALLPSAEHPTQTPDNTCQTTELPVETQNTPQQAFISYKLILQHHTQKSHISNPIYEVCNEGSAHAPRFRATVLVCEKRYTSHTTFTHRKAAEHDAAKIAWDDIAPKTDDEEKLPDIEEYALFCKSILYDFASKMHFNKPTFDTHTLYPDALVRSFKSVVTFNGKSYTGEPGQTKKEAEQLAARAAILSLLESELKNDLSKMIKSKAKLFAKLNNVRDSSHLSTTNSSSGEVASMNNAIESLPSGLETVSSAQAADLPCHDTGKGVLKNNDDGSSQPGLVQVSSAQVMSPPDHEFNKPAVHSPTVSVAQPRSFVPPSVQHYIRYVHICGQKRKWNNK